MSARLRSLLLPGLATIIVGTLLIGLGIWQLHRLSWKEAIITRIETRTRAAPQPLPPPPIWAALKPEDYDYRRVGLEGTFRNDATTLVFRGSDEGPGYLVMTAFNLQGGGTVIVDRGFIPADMKADAERTAAAPAGLVHVSGLMRPPEPRNMFTPADEPAKNIFFTRDPKLIAAHLGLTDAAPFVVDADATPDRGSWPRGGMTQLAIPNNHFSYALTWFGLALGLFGVFATFAWRRIVQDTANQAGDTASMTAPFRR